MSFAKWATLLSKVDLNKLRFNVKNDVTLICATFGADLIKTSKVTGRKTERPRFCATLWLSKLTNERS